MSPLMRQRRFLFNKERGGHLYRDLRNLDFNATTDGIVKNAASSKSFTCTHTPIATNGILRALFLVLRLISNNDKAFYY